MKIGFLKTDALRQEFTDKFGEYPDMFSRRFMEFDNTLQFATYDVQLNQYPESLDEVDVFLITGSKNSVYDNEPWIQQLMDFVRKLYDEKKPLIGICFGHQLIAQALGGETRKADQGWQVGVQENHILAAGRAAGLRSENYRLISSHQDQVKRAAPGSEILASSLGCPIAMTRMGGHIFSVQGHPEFEPAFARDLYTYRRSILGDRLTDRALASLSKRTDSATILQFALDYVSQGIQ